MSAPGQQPEWLDHVLQLRETVLEAAMTRGFDAVDAELTTLRKTLYALHGAQVAGLLGVIATLLATQ